MKSAPKTPTVDLIPQNHVLETRIRNDLMAQPDLRFSSLVVHRIPDGVCLEGVVITTVDDSEVCQIVREVSGVSEVLNHLVICPDSQPKKG